MKILSDFDGVLTDQTEEGLRVSEIFCERLGELSHLPDDRIAEMVSEGEAAMAASPHRHGWSVGSRVTAFANEDLFIRVNGLASCFDTWADEGRPRYAELRDVLARKGIADFKALAQEAYLAMVRETQSGHLKPLDPEAADVIRRLLDAGHEVVVVSNSSTDRILELFARAGLEAVAHDEDPTARLRVRGGARKFELAEAAASPRGFNVGDYFIEVDRPSYERILREERPAVVIGDVFSLDLALPLHLSRTEGGDFAGTQLFLRTRSYTPDWSREFAAQAVGDGMRFLDTLEELPRHLA